MTHDTCVQAYAEGMAARLNVHENDGCKLDVP